MTPPINIDGTDITGATIDGQDVEQITIDGQDVLSAIPDSVVSRPDDGSSTSASTPRGLEIEFSNDFESVGARISNMTSSVTTAEVRDSSGTVLDTTDISNLTSGDSFALSANFNAGDKYRILVSADGAGYTTGFTDSTDYPVTSADVDITARATGTSTSTDTAAGGHGINDVGNPDNILG